MKIAVICFTLGSTPKMPEKELETLIDLYLNPEDLPFCEKVERIRVIDLAHFELKTSGAIQVYELIKDMDETRDSPADKMPDRTTGLNLPLDKDSA